ncbi:MAG: ABC transporter ATP-binding protein, partial [Pseudoxanthomonas sp.]
TLLLVSHDRDFIDNVVTSTLVLEGGGRLGDYVGGYNDWLRQRPSGRTGFDSAGVITDRTAQEQVIAANAAAAAAPSAPKKKLSFKDQRELEQLPLRIEQLETDIAKRTAAMAEPAFFQQDPASIVAANEALAALNVQLETAYARWSELDG